MYIKGELIKLVKAKKSMLFFIVMFLIPFIDLLMNVLRVYSDYWFHPEAYFGGLPKSMILHPAMGSFLAGSSEGHIPQMLLIWMLPIYIMNIYSDIYIKESQEGYHVAVLSRMDKREFLRKRFSVSFWIPFIISMVSLSVNFLLAQIVFYKGTDMMGMDFYIEKQDFFAWSVTNPDIAYMGYILVYSLIAGIYGIVCTGVSFLFPNNKIAYAIVFFVWIAQIISPYSLTYAMQPFIEYGPEYFIPALLIFVAIAIGIYVVSYRYKVKSDEI